MDLSKQVVSLELAKRLKELGVEQISLFYWWQPENVTSEHCILVYEENLTMHEFIKSKCISAFTCAELGELLPIQLIKENTIEINGIQYPIKYDYHIKISKFFSDHWHCCYIGYPILEGFTLSSLGSHSFSENDENLSNAIAKILIYLIENGVMGIP